MSPDEPEEIADPWADYDSGPFCRHWSAAGDCELKCARCGHDCGMHAVPFDGGTGQLCFEEGCDCPAWAEPPNAGVVLPSAAHERR